MGEIKHHTGFAHARTQAMHAHTLATTAARPSAPICPPFPSAPVPTLPIFAPCAHLGPTHSEAQCVTKCSICPSDRRQRTDTAWTDMSTDRYCVDPAVYVQRCDACQRTDTAWIQRCTSSGVTEDPAVCVQRCNATFTEILHWTDTALVQRRHDSTDIALNPLHGFSKWRPGWGTFCNSHVAPLSILG
jgi:hypothetical protein